MTDLQRFVDLYKSFGIDVIVNQESNPDNGYWICFESNRYDDRSTYIYGPGTHSFYILFNKEEKFKEQELSNTYYLD